MDLLKGLNKEQKKAVTHEKGPLLIIAGAGTGKTTVITRRLAYLVEKKLARTDEILALTFTEKAAGEMEDRIDQLLPYGYLDLWISTFHAFCKRILKDYGLEMGLDPDAKILDDTGQWLLIRKNLDKFNLDYYKPLGKPTKSIKALTQHFSKLKDEAISTKEYLDYAEKLTLDSDNLEYIKKSLKTDENTSTINDILGQEIARIKEVAEAYHTYQRLLQQEGYLDFGDLINYTIELFNKRPRVLEQLRKQFKYVLVDEFQDTNWAQFELIKMLAAPDNNLTVVGDDDQAIYRFRGASVSNILQFQDIYKNAEEIFLTTSYRSKQNILDLAYNFIQLNNPDRLEFKLKDKKLSKKLVANKKGTGTITHTEVSDQEEERRYVVKKIIDLITTKKVDSLNDIAILVRSNETAEGYMNALSDAEIDYQFLASRGLFRKPIIVDIISYFKLLDSYHESTALFRVLSWDLMKVDPEDLAKLTHLSRKKQWSLYHTLSHYHGHIHISDRTKKLLFKLTRLIEKHTELSKTRSPQQLFIQVLIDFGIQKHLNEKPNYTNYQKLWQLQQFFKEIVNFSVGEEDAHLKEFMDYFNYLLESGEQGSIPSMGDEGPEAVRIMTIHSSKGLEFEYVFIPKLIDKSFPSISGKNPIEIPEPLIREILPEGDVHIQEERRLFYVACTRAKSGIFFSTAKDYGGKTERKSSQFLLEIGLVKKDVTKKIKKPTGIVDFTKEPKLKKRKSPVDRVWHPPLPSKFSFSQFRAFETCPWQYRYAFLLKIPVPGKASFSFGQSMHNTLYQMHTLAKERQGTRVVNLFDQSPKKSNKTLGELIEFKEVKNIYESSWQPDWFDSLEEQNEYKKQGLAQLKKVYETEIKNTNLPYALEEGFTLKLKNAIIKGRIDRMDVDGKEVEIIDYKTGKVKVKLTKDDKLQLLIYQLALEKVARFKDATFVLSYYYLTDGSKASFKATEKELKDAEGKLEKLVDEMRTSDFKATPSQFICANCDYKDICPFKIG